jgi:glycosyltransferase involved in cell wall biosynthesis
VDTLYLNCRIILQRPVPTVRSLFTLIKAISWVLRSDIVHIHMPYPFVESYVSFLSWICRKKLVVTYHMDAKLDSDEAEERANKPLINKIIESAYYLLSSKYPLNLSDVICTNTMKYAKDSSILQSRIQKVQVIYQGIKQNLYASLDNDVAFQVRNGYLGNEYKYLVSFVGRLVPYKGLLYLLEAIKIINERTDLRICFVIGGKGTEHNKLVSRADALGLKNVAFIGFVAEAELCNLFRASDVVVSPSISSLESTPISLLCSLMCGTPVVGTTVGGTEETIPSGDYAKIVNPRDSEGLANAIVELLHDAQHDVLKKTPLIDLRFWSHVSTDYVRVFNRLVSNMGMKQTSGGRLEAVDKGKQN